MTKFNKLNKGSILSESQYYTVEKIVGDKVQLINDNNENIVVDKDYVESCLISADQFEKEESKTMTELAELFINSPRIAMTVAFYKKDVEKTKKVYDAEKKAYSDKVANAKMSDIPGLVDNLIENPITKFIPGELRVMQGRHYGKIDELGRISFIDMEIKQVAGNHDIRLRNVDPRTITFLIIAGVRYSLKK